ncbi:MT-A70 family methyltransferase [Endozoicomonas sp. SCSIO W0465]|uniref:Spo0J and IME4 domain-containing protein n=1 Tax=Endozoicomonas sp. SCSIO W0465 TaxID=2918516 RepID=UPI002075F608|nr:MT-A70 family methyltransferase [Endozoicomonas sp. SCSIO W0465]USE39218.1 MT-A70 family methyltransferase [Endozoicomonas sp. SCSIO W0465]
MTELAFHAIADIFPLMDGQPLADLTDDIKQHGLREPIWLYDGQILDGRNRYRACLAAGVEPVFADYQDDDPVGFVVSLNLHRRHLNKGQKAISAGKAADAKKEDNLKRGSEGQIRPSGKTTISEAAKQFDVGSTTVKSAKQVLKTGTERLAQRVVEDKVSVSTAADIATLPPNEQDIIVSLGEKAILMAAKEIRQKKAIERQEANNRIRQQALTTPPPDGQYRCIVIDPPWPMQKIERDLHPEQTPELDYPVMTLEDISDIDLPAADQCHLYLWTTQRFIWCAKDLLTHWGFKHLAIQVWHKNGGFQPAGLPQYNCEFVLIGRKGGLEFMTTKNFPLCFDAPRREHSRKPDAFYDLVRRVSPGPRIDMFSREKREGFEQHGVEIDVF